MQPLRVLAFDLDNTLIDRDAICIRGLDGWLDAQGFSESKRARVRSELIAADRSGNATRAEFCRAAEQILACDAEAAREMWLEVKRLMLQALEPDREVHAFLHRLKPIAELAIVSNGTSEMQRAKIRLAALEPFFPVILISEEVGAHKPDPAIFSRLLELTGAAPAEVLFIGDNPINDIHGARFAGMRTCWVRGSSREENIEADWIVDRILDLEKILAVSTGTGAA